MSSKRLSRHMTTEEEKRERDQAGLTKFENNDKQIDKKQWSDDTGTHQPTMQQNGKE